MSEQTEEEYLIERLSKLLAEISVIVNGPEPMGVLWSYADLPEKVRALKAPPAAVLTNPYTGQPRDYRDVESDPAGVLMVEPGTPLVAAPPAAVPAGYALVPVEPTQGMLDAAGMSIVPAGKEWLDQSNRETWAAMLAAAERKGDK